MVDDREVMNCMCPTRLKLVCIHILIPTLVCLLVLDLVFVLVLILVFVISFLPDFSVKADPWTPRAPEPTEISGLTCCGVEQ